MKRILIIEDNEDLAFGLSTNLEMEGYEVCVAADGKTGLAAMGRSAPDLLVLDLMLPKIDGFDVLRALNDSPRRPRVLILSARGEEIDKVRGLRLGADDYLTKPFGLMELFARVEALLRRDVDPPSGDRSPNRLRFGHIDVLADQRRVLRDGKEVALAPKEYDLLLELVRSNGAVLSRLELMRRVWGHSSAVVSRTVDTHIGELRRKLEADPANPKWILTVRKAGYRIAIGEK